MISHLSLQTGDTIYEVEIATAHNKGFFSMSDTVHTVKCVYESRYIYLSIHSLPLQENPLMGLF